MCSRARCSVSSFTGSWWLCARTCGGSGGQGQGPSLSGGPRLGRAGSCLTSFSRSFRTRSTTSTSDLSFIQVSTSCHEEAGPPVTKPLAGAGPEPTRALPQPRPPTASQMASRCRASSLWAISLRRCRYQPSKWGDLKNRLWGTGGGAVGLAPCAEGWARAPCPPAAGASGLLPAVHAPVEAQPVALEDAGELRPRTL